MDEIQMKPGISEKKGVSIAGLILLLVLGLLFVFLVGQKSHIICTRASENEVNCEITSVWMGRVTVSSREAIGVSNAYIESDYDSDEDTTTYRVVLRAKEKDVPVTRAYSSGNIKKMELADNINNFIKYSARSEAEFEYTGAGGIITAIIVGVFFVVLAAGMFLSRRR